VIVFIVGTKDERVSDLTLQVLHYRMIFPILLRDIVLPGANIGPGGVLCLLRVLRKYEKLC
jgi:hypothetical protein